MTTRACNHWFCLVFMTIVLGGCGPGRYGYARYYVPLDSEEAYHESAREFTFGAVTARPQDFTGQLISWFGVVEKVQAAKDGRSLIRMTFHKQNASSLRRRDHLHLPSDDSPQSHRHFFRCRHAPLGRYSLRARQSSTRNADARLREGALHHERKRRRRVRQRQKGRRHSLLRLLPTMARATVPNDPVGHENGSINRYITRLKKRGAMPTIRAAAPTGYHRARDTLLIHI
jgi:hypothetical protein